MSTKQMNSVVDVRTLKEWSASSIRIGIADETFKVQLEGLKNRSDCSSNCRSGNRAGQAIEIMRDLESTGELVNGGSAANASLSLGLEVVVDG
jgi:rhodanese-related sulfurtransferase